MDDPRLDNEVKRSMRFPGALYRRLEAIARREHRTVLSQIIKMLEDGADRYESRDKRESESGNGALVPSDGRQVVTA